MANVEKESTVCCICGQVEGPTHTYTTCVFRTRTQVPTTITLKVKPHVVRAVLYAYLLVYYHYVRSLMDTASLVGHTPQDLKLAEDLRNFYSHIEYQLEMEGYK